MPCAVPPSPAPPCSASSRHPRRTSRARAASAAAAAAAPARPFSSGPDASQLPALLSQLASLASDAGPAAPARAAQGARALARLVSSVLRDAAAGRPPRSPPALLRALFDDLGATYTKLGQFVASSPTLFPPEYVAELQGCLDEGAPPVPFSAVRALVEAELGQPLGAVFESFEPQPLASASVAQVHAAVLRGSRKEVAVKARARPSACA